MLQATWDWYYGSAEEEVLNDCQFGEPYSDTSANNSSEVVVRPGTYENGDSVNIFTVDSKENSETAYLESCSKVACLSFAILVIRQKLLCNWLYINN